MRNRWLLSVVSMAALITALAARSSAAPTRNHVTCAQFGAELKKVTHATLKAGDWAKLPAALRVLPPKAELCGSTGPTVIIASPLFGKELEDYYRPLFEKANCKPVKCEVTEKKSICSCRGDGFGRVGTEELNEAYSVSWF